MRDVVVSTTVIDAELGSGSSAAVEEQKMLSHQYDWYSVADLNYRIAEGLTCDSWSEHSYIHR